MDAPREIKCEIIPIIYSIMKRNMNPSEERQMNQSRDGNASNAALRPSFI